MKRLLAASVLAAGLIPWADGARASTTTTGGAQIQWKASASLALAIVTQYNAAFAQGNAIPPLLASAAGVCVPAGTEANYTMTFGALTPSKTVPTGCLYKNALAVSVSTNDAAGFAINEYLDSTPTTGVGICAFPNGGATFPLAPTAALTTSGRGGAPAAGTFAGNALTSCAAGGSIVPPGTGGVSSNGANPGNPGAPGLEFYSPSGTALSFVTSAGPTLSGGVITTMYGGEDIQVNLAPNALSTAVANTGIYLTIQLIPN